LQGLPEEDIKAILKENYEDLINDCDNIVGKLISDEQSLRINENPNIVGMDSAIMESLQTSDPSLNGDIVLRISSPHNQLLNDVVAQSFSERPYVPFRKSSTGTVNSDSQRANSPDTSLDMSRRFSAPNIDEFNLGRFDTIADFELNAEPQKKAAEPTARLRRASFAAMLNTPSDTDFEMSNAFRIIGDNNTKHNRPRRNSMTDSKSFKDDRPYNCGNILSSQRNTQI
jgi:hypothetical protein